jgi:hypothetical protein
MYIKHSKDTDWRQTKTKHTAQKTKEMSNTDPPKKPEVNPGSHEG